MKFTSLSRFYFASLTATAAAVTAVNADSFHSDIVTPGGGGGGLRQRRQLNDEIPLGKIGSCSRDEPCGRCEGDCHRDSDCEGDLVCYNVSGKHDPGDFCAKIPGCSGEDLSKTDWCIRPEDMPVPNLCDTREEANSHQNNNNNNNNNTEEEEEEPVAVVETSSCDELESLVFELTTKINDVDAETVRYQILTDELEQTAMIADPDVSEGRRRRRALNQDDSTLVFRSEVEGGLEKLIIQEQRLSAGNSRVSELNSAIRKHVGVWRDENGVLHGRVNDLSIENQALQAERDSLSVQIDELGSNINNLQDLIDAHGELNTELDSSVSDLEAEINRLKAENEEYQRLNNELSSSIDELESQVAGLEEQNEVFAGLNDQLAATQVRLDGQVAELTQQNGELSMHVSDLETTVTRLSNETDRLIAVNDELEENIETLQDEVETLEDTVEQLGQLNGQLETIVSFVNETSIGIDESVDQVTAYLAEQIVGYRSVAQETLQNIYLQRVQLWDCAYRDAFGDYNFAFDERLEIPEQDVEGGVFDMVIEYVDDRVLSELCLSVDNFEEYLEAIFKDPVYTSNHLINGMNTYTSLALAHYFPKEEDAGGLTPEDWAMAGYDCANLPEDMQFRYTITP